MEYSVVTYGGGEVLEGLFNAIATLLNSQRGSIFTPLVRLGLFVGLLWTAIITIWDTPLAFIRNWLLPFYLILNVLFVPQASVWVIDPVLKFQRKIDHVPVGLAIFAGTVSTIGDGITKEVEKVFALPDELKYHKTGAIFASHLIKQSRTFQITNGELAENMRGFVNQCVVYDALIGSKYTLDDLKNSDDIWKLVSSNASPARSFVWTPPHKPGEAPGKSEITTCREGVKKFNALWKDEINQAGLIGGKKVFGSRANSINPKAELFKYLPVSFEYMAKMAKSAEEIMRQQMMIYSVVDAVEHKSTSLGNSPNYAIRRAYLQQRSTYETLGGLAAENLPIIKNVFEALSYAAILFVLPLALLPFGWQIITQWAGLILWVQMWAPLYAVLNYIMTIAARSQSLTLTALTGGSGVTLANSVGLTNANADMAAMAGYLSMSIPFISYALVKGGAGAFVHLASHLGAVSQSSAGLAAGEATSGNFNFGNVSSGNVQSANTNAFQHNTSPNYSSGIFTQHDGRISQTTSSDGQHILNVSNSNLPSSINASESISNSLSHQATTAAQVAQSKLQAATESQADAYRDVIDFATHHAKQSSSGESWSHGSSVSEAKSIEQTAQLTERFAKDNNISTSEAARLLAGASVGGGIEFGKWFSVSANASAQGETGSMRQELFAKAQDFVHQTGYREALSQSSQALKESRFNAQDEQAHRYAEAVSGSLEKANSLRKEASEHLQRSESYAEAAAWTRQNATTINDNLNQEYVEWLKDQPLGGKGPMGIHEASVIIASRPDVNKAYQTRFMEEQQGKMEQYLSQHPVHSAQDVEQAYTKNNSASSSLAHGEKQNFDLVREQAQSKGLGVSSELPESSKQEAEKQFATIDSKVQQQKGALKEGADKQVAQTKQGLNQNAALQAIPGLRSWQEHPFRNEQSDVKDYNNNDQQQKGVWTKQPSHELSVARSVSQEASKEPVIHQRKEQEYRSQSSPQISQRQPTSFSERKESSQPFTRHPSGHEPRRDQAYQESAFQAQQVAQPPQISSTQRVTPEKNRSSESLTNHSRMITDTQTSPSQNSSTSNQTGFQQEHAQTRTKGTPPIIPTKYNGAPDKEKNVNSTINQPSINTHQQGEEQARQAPTKSPKASVRRTEPS